MDIETAPNIGFFWRPGYKIQISHDNIIKERAIICICYKWEGEDDVWYLNWDKNQDDSDMVREFIEVMNEADEVVGHNIDRFDLPWVKGRAFKLGVPISPYLKTVDTLAWAKKMGLNSNRLDYIGKFKFGDGKIETNFGMWKDIVLNNDKQALKDMVTYCCKDVTLLESVFKALAPYNRPKTHAGVMAGGEKWHCPNTGSSNVALHKRRVTAAGTKQFQMQNKDTGSYFTINERSYKMYLEEKDA